MMRIHFLRGWRAQKSFFNYMYMYFIVALTYGFNGGRLTNTQLNPSQPCVIRFPNAATELLSVTAFSTITDSLTTLQKL